MTPARRAWLDKNRDRLRALDRQKYWADPEKARARVRGYYAANAEQVKEREASRRAKRPERYKAADKKWRDTHPERQKAKLRKWREQNPDKVTEWSHRRRALETATSEPFARQEIYDRDGGRCHICKRRVSAQNFHVDHLVPLSKGGSNTRDNVAVAHPFCNLSRGPGRIDAQLRLTG